MFMVKILATIQARMGSSRLPKKIMLPILGKPVIWHIYKRLRFCKELDQICIATSTSDVDDSIEIFAKKNKISIYRGPEKDLIKRLLEAAKKFDAEAIVRVTGDCPLVDPQIVDEIVKIFKNGLKYEFISNTIERTFPDGLDVEIMSVEFLKELESQLMNQYDREYFVSYIMKNKTRYKCYSLKNNQDFSHMRWTLDYPKDYDFIKKIFEILFNDSTVFHMKDILQLIKSNPELEKINKK